MPVTQERIREKMSEFGLKQKDMIEYLNEGQSTVARWLSTNDKIKNDIPTTIILKIADYLKVSPYWLLDLDEPDFDKPERENNIIVIEKLDVLAGAGSAGYLDVPKENNKLAFDKKLLGNVSKPEFLKIIEVIGDSMHPDFDEGDYALIDMVGGRDNFIKIAGTYVVRVADVMYIKSVEFLPKNNVRLKSLNPKYADILPHKEGYDYEIVGKVCGKIKLEKGLFFDYQGIK